MYLYIINYTTQQNNFLYYTMIGNLQLLIIALEFIVPSFIRYNV